MIESYIVTFGITCVGAIVWAVRLEGKINENQQVSDGRLNEHDQLFVEREKQTGSTLLDMKAHLTRIEGKLDSIAYGSIKSA